MFKKLDRNSVIGKLTLKLALVSISLVIVSACSSSGSSSEPNGSDTGSTTGSTNNNIPISGDYDLSEYLFHLNVLTAGGEISFVERLYGKVDEGDGSFNISREFVNNGGTINESSSNKIIKNFSINANSIDESLLESGDFRTAQRFANVGDTYMNADSKPVTTPGGVLQQNVTCELQEHLDTFDLSTATGDQALSSGVYQDVLKIECVTGFIRNGTVQPHSNIRSYFAKDIGVVFNEGNLLFFEDVYIIEDY